MVRLRSPQEACPPDELAWQPALGPLETKYVPWDKGPRDVVLPDTSVKLSKSSARSLGFVQTTYLLVITRTDQRSVL